MDNKSCFSLENTRCRIAGFDFNEDFNCKVCLKTGYVKVIQTMEKRGRSEKLTAAGIAEKLSGTQGAAGDTSEVCKYRGKLLQRAKCKCGDGAVWECSILGKQIGKACGKEKCKSYQAAN